MDDIFLYLSHAIDQIRKLVHVEVREVRDLAMPMMIVSSMHVTENPPSHKDGGSEKALL